MQEIDSPSLASLSTVWFLGDSAQEVLPRASCKQGKIGEPNMDNKYRYETMLIEVKQSETELV